MTWTPEKIKILRDNWNDKSASQIAALIGDKSRNAVIGKAHRMGLRAGIIRFGKSRKATPKIARKKTVASSKVVSIDKAAISKHRESVKTPEPESKAIPLVDLKPNQCRWTDDSATFCAHKQREGSSYCQHHYERVTVKSAPRYLRTANLKRYGSR